MEGKEVGTIELNDAVFGVEINEHLVHMAVVNQLANNRPPAIPTQRRSTGASQRKISPLSILETGASVLPFSWTAPCWERPAALLPSSATILWTPKDLYASAETMAAWRLSSRSPGLRSEAWNLARSLP